MARDGAPAGAAQPPSLAGFSRMATAELALGAGDFREPLLLAPGLEGGAPAALLPPDDRERLAVDAEGALAWPGPRKQVLLLGDPYAELRALAPAGAAHRALYEQLHMSLSCARRVWAASSEAAQAFCLLHGRPAEFIELPPLRWAPASAPPAAGTEPVVVVTCGQPELQPAAREATEQLAAMLHDARVRLLPAGPDALPQLCEAMAGRGDAVLAHAAVHVHVGRGTLDCNRLRLHESWINGIPVVQLLLAPSAPEPRTIVDHGNSGLLVTGRDELPDTVAWLLASPEYAQQLAQRARIHALRETPTWAALRRRFAQ